MRCAGPTPSSELPVSRPFSTTFSTQATLFPSGEIATCSKGRTDASSARIDAMRRSDAELGVTRVSTILDDFLDPGDSFSVGRNSNLLKGPHRRELCEDRCDAPVRRRARSYPCLDHSRRLSRPRRLFFRREK